ncbi:MAG: glycosidase [Chitinophagaceae bacterium]|nr:glycosidase [Chitinophagaceae bacterium]
MQQNQHAHIKSDRLIFKPDDVDLSRSPLRNGLKEKTFVLGAFNPGLCRLSNGNLLMMVRIAEALTDPVVNDKAHCIRWEASGNYTTDSWPLQDVVRVDPRKFSIKAYGFPVYALTSLSWLLPVELNADGSRVEMIHYDKIIAPEFASQEYGIEDPRISLIDGRYYMTVCCVSSERHSTMLYASEDGLNYNCMGVVLDHQNKDMLLFEGTIGKKYFALTRPMGECYFASSPGSLYHPGAAIHMATSPDLLHWKPMNQPFIRARRASLSNEKIGGGTPPILTKDGWLILYHGVQQSGGAVGVYRTFWALMDRNDPLKVLRLEDITPLLEANENLTIDIQHQAYLQHVVFTTGIVAHGNDYIIVSGELDLACRITHILKEYFSLEQ